MKLWLFLCPNIMLKEVEFLEFSAVPGISDLVNDLSKGKQIVNGLPLLPSQLADFEPTIKAKLDSYPAENRNRLVATLRGQYQEKSLNPIVEKQLSKLAMPNCVSISCGHQLVMFGGPMYVAFKILSVIKLANELEAALPNYQFVPIHWLHGEDHDVEEVSKLSFFSKPMVWETSQTGSVGDLSTEGLEELANEIASKSADQSALLYSKGETLMASTFSFLHHWFGSMGLLQLDASAKTLKELFLPIAKREIQEKVAQSTILATTKALEKAGYKAQIQPREVNLFWLENGQRYRIAPHENGFELLGSGQQISQDQLLEKMEASPEKVSPNVALRPLYSQLILPDVAFFGGPAELSYWAQFTGLFQAFDVPMPVIIPRFSALIIKDVQKRKLDKWELGVKALFEDEPALKRAWLLKTSNLPLDLKTMEQELENWWGQLAILAAKTDGSLESWVLAEQARFNKQTENVFKRILKIGETSFEGDWQQFLNLKSRLLPNGHLQEREEAWFGFCLNNPLWLQEIYSQIEVLKPGLKVLAES